MVVNAEMVQKSSSDMKKVAHNNGSIEVITAAFTMR
jgi:hypothetical protein